VTLGVQLRSVSRPFGEDSICTSIIVASEIRFGARKRGSLRLAEHVEALLSVIPVLPFAAPADKHYGHIRAELERAGTPIGPNEMLIAAQALALGLVVVTANYREYSRVRDLRVENWLL
jgi:tRNA(fMet)-specific endonuclease VapC